ncbi:ubiquinol-cytochrome c reductase cytochrome b subunit [Streptomyces sp. RB6PN25]|uniref:Cytochrome bc1 complex cytochrome b subunit n=1 Tax=Streptomyces humicola TaxID=2953240 RepID=A0ABT1PQY9_9ACTN|nr:ubiquinol-cytochrome c reductase cytochrome b subunit [Streptomyces humicola]MCQ4080079.1 ubiquinol-cytochrome c reductase cytochrome b subunit [Streptomyces humicola]
MSEERKAPAVRSGRLEGRAGKAAERAFTALDQRLPAAEGGTLLRKVFPDHWSFLLGEIALYSFVVLLLTGVYLTFFFDPSMNESVYRGAYAPLHGVLATQAYSSTLRISFEVRGGLLIRQMHHWAALVFVAAVGAHMLRIFFTGAFRRPREGNWLIGVTLFQLAMLEGFCGYSLPDDLLSGTGLRTAATIIGSIPVVGTYLNFFAFGGAYPGHDFIPRLYVVHILLVPGALVGLITAHLILVVYLKHTHWGGPGRTNSNVVGAPMVPQFTAKTTGFFFMIFGLLAALGALAQVNPIWRYGPYRADQVSTDAQPDWYVGFLEGALRLMGPWETNVWGHTFMWNVLVPAVLLPAVLFVVLYLYPFFERWVTGDQAEHHLCDRPRNRPTRTAFGVAAITFYAVLLLAGGNDVIAYSLRVSVNSLTWLFRGAVFIAPPLAFAVTKRICLGLQAHDRDLLSEGEETGRVSQEVYGRIDEGRRPLPERRRYTLLLRDVPLPLQPAEDEPRPVPRRRRLRLVLSSWYYRDRVELPVGAAPPRPEVTAPPREPLTEREEGGSAGQ